ncbi:hypothetical protein OUZ56_004411 [Daphnia magna]|uniref:Uncharacterized protein n=1 Tax=Daphnia magna TaxID=35525 RepID=A0ABQ9YPP6_9CRUS|nr:hypothetical protein OUZ56_004411 [Daphnia magna]
MAMAWCILIENSQTHRPPQHSTRLFLSLGLNPFGDWVRIIGHLITLNTPQTNCFGFLHVIRIEMSFPDDCNAISDRSIAAYIQGSS